MAEGFTEEREKATADDNLLAATWQQPPGVIGWLMADDHKTIGLRFIVTALVFFVLGGIEALVLRVQLAQPLADVISPEIYNQIFTMHGTTMMFFFAVPILEGIGIYVVPMMIGARDTAFPRLNAYSYYVYLLAGITLYFGFFIGRGPDAGWFSYPPLSDRLFSPSDGVDFWALSVTLLEFSALTQAITLIVTILKVRAPGMTLARMPILVWAFLTMSVLVAVAMPTLILASLMLEFDRTFATQFFDPGGGGDPLLWQHLFWWFGHPDVYIIFLPAFGIVATILATFARREVVGYAFVVLGIIAIGVINLSVWAHHMLAVGLPWLALGFFAAMTMAIAIPSGVHIFAWLATVWSSQRLWFSTPFLFTIAFIVTFVLGGISGVTLAAVPFNLQVHDTHYVVAHFHYVLIGGMVFPLFGGLYYWFPKVTGRLLSERVGVWNFWFAFVGFNLAFLPMHLSGFWGMPRRVYTYHPELGIALPNLITTVGAFLFAAAVLLLFVNMAISARRGRRAGDNPWAANTLEWATSSPAPNYNFRIIPSVRSRNPLWMQPEFEPTEHGYGDEDHPDEKLWVELRADRQETLGTSVVMAEPESRVIFAGPSIWPFLTAVSTGIAVVGLMISPWVTALGGLLAFFSLWFWHWPEEAGGRTAVVLEPTARERRQRSGWRRLSVVDLPDHVSGPKEVVWWGMWVFIVIEMIMIGGLIFAYYYLSLQVPIWPPGDIRPPDLPLPIVYSLVLLASSGAMWWGDSAAARGDNRNIFIGLLGAAGLGTLYVVLKAVEFVVSIEYSWYDHAYGSLSWTISWFHGLHVVATVLKAGALLPFAWRGYFTPERRTGVEVNGLYWHFVVLAWIPLFITLYLAPRWL